MPRECSITREDLRSFHCGEPAALVAKMKAAGFVFEREQCPVKIAPPYHIKGLPDGTLQFIQFESPGEGAP
jgi:hypothetical protein